MRKQDILVADRYRCLRPLGRGGFAEVYLAEDRRLGNRRVALKLLSAHVIGDPEKLQKFRQEAEIIGHLSNPFTVRAYDFGHDDQGHYYIAMEYVQGETLHDILKREGILSVERALKMGIQLLDALEEAHQMGVIHRDLKPKNIILQPHRLGEIVKVLDFGVARILRQANEDDEWTLVGTATYMSPEQAQGLPVSPSSDLYSIGVILYHALTGTPPFVSQEDPVAIMIHHATKPVVPMRQRRPDLPIPEDLDRAILRAMEKKPHLRYEQAGLFREQLEGALEHYIQVHGEGTSLAFSIDTLRDQPPTDDDSWGGERLASKISSVSPDDSPPRPLSPRTSPNRSFSLASESGGKERTFSSTLDDQISGYTLSQTLDDPPPVSEAVEPAAQKSMPSHSRPKKTPEVPPHEGDLHTEYGDNPAEPDLKTAVRKTPTQPSNYTDFDLMAPDFAAIEEIVHSQNPALAAKLAASLPPGALIPGFPASASLQGLSPSASLQGLSPSASYPGFPVSSPPPFSPPYQEKDQTQPSYTVPKEVHSSPLPLAPVPPPQTPFPSPASPPPWEAMTPFEIHKQKQAQPWGAAISSSGTEIVPSPDLEDDELDSTQQHSTSPRQNTAFNDIDENESTNQSPSVLVAPSGQIVPPPPFPSSRPSPPPPIPLSFYVPTPTPPATPLISLPSAPSYTPPSLPVITGALPPQLPLTFGIPSNPATRPSPPTAFPSPVFGSIPEPARQASSPPLEATKMLPNPTGSQTGFPRPFEPSPSSPRSSYDDLYAVRNTGSSKGLTSEMKAVSSGRWLGAIVGLCFLTLFIVVLAMAGRSRSSIDEEAVARETNYKRLISQGEQATMKGDYHQAYMAFREALALKPDEPEAKQRLQQIIVDLKASKALVQSKGLLKQGRLFDAHTKLQEISTNSSFWEDREKVWKELLPRMEASVLQELKYAQRRKNWSGAIASCRRLERFSPKHPILLSSCARLIEKHGD